VAEQRRLLLVHAHPDDESIETGATMAAYAAQGAGVTLVTCTLGELGEVIPPGLAHLAGGPLGQHRTGELAAACAALGVTDHRFLGGPGRWRDSGMMGLPDNADPRCFWQADVAGAAATLAAVIRDVRPQVLVTYDAHGYFIDSGSNPVTLSFTPAANKSYTNIPFDFWAAPDTAPVLAGGPASGRSRVRSTCGSKSRSA